ncbi:unnamed protein product [Protopolystoma xenopodis]|uniref:Rho-GAP domain-containing protein n=1 Tax=Protopolystoma xenopodis TaxID=117903 RepID=A0A448WWD4_9PLAT|nr:unnamed protein product [Protopolystoma xenopodis]
MTSGNLGIVFAPSLFRPINASVAAIMSTRFASTAVEIMIDYASDFFPRPPLPLSLPPVIGGTSGVSTRIPDPPGIYVALSNLALPTLANNPSLLANELGEARE